MTLQEIQPVSSGKHLRLICTSVGVRVRCMKFGTTLEAFPYKVGDVLDLAVELEVNEYNGRELLSVIVRDMKARRVQSRNTAGGTGVV